jgi:hypothetical protein
MNKIAAEQKIASLGLTPLQAAQAIGSLHALAEADCNVKQAAEYLGTTEEVVVALTALAE